MPEKQTYVVEVETRVRELYEFPFGVPLDPDGKTADKLVHDAAVNKSLMDPLRELTPRDVGEERVRIVEVRRGDERIYPKPRATRAKPTPKSKPAKEPETK